MSGSQTVPPPASSSSSTDVSFVGKFEPFTVQANKYDSTESRNEGMSVSNGNAKRVRVAAQTIVSPGYVGETNISNSSTSGKRGHKRTHGQNSHAMFLLSGTVDPIRQGSNRNICHTRIDEDEVHFDAFFANAPLSVNCNQINQDLREPDTPASFEAKRRRLRSRPNQHLYQGRPPE